VKLLVVGYHPSVVAICKSPVVFEYNKRLS
jgi:hypothetical protein